MMKPLSVGNVVSAGLRIYRDNFKKYYRLAFISSLWGLVPVYGWAKFYAYQALIARLAYGEVTEKPESIQDANRLIKGKMWSFLGAAILVGLRFMLAYVLGAIAIALIGGVLITMIISALSLVLGESGGAIGAILSIIIYIAIFVLFIAYLTRLFASFSATELLLATKENLNASESMKASQEMTKSYLKNLILIYLIASLVSFPIWGLIFTLQILPAFLQQSNPFFASGIFTVLTFIFNAVTSALILPFWQSVKAVIYYDLKVRREGMGLDLRK
ncbi:MAG: DUF975 domain-containing protein [Cyanobacteria bacterium J06600_6]